MKRASLLVLLAAACGGSAPASLDQVSLAAAALCAEHAGKYACAPGAVCVVTQNGWTDCICCTLPPDAGWSITFFNTNPDADCAAQARDWARWCPAP